MRKIKSCNKAGLKFISVVPKDDRQQNDKYMVECMFCQNVFPIWASTYYSNKNPCECQKPNKMLYKTYYNIRTRCYNNKSNRFMYYQGKGVTLCDEWQHNYKAFEHWALNNGYQAGLTIDRINVNKGYSPDNCRWVDKYEQANNKTNNIMFVVAQYKTSLRHLCECFDINYKSAMDWFYKHHRNISAMIKYLRTKTGCSQINQFDYDQDYDKALLPLSFIQGDVK